MQEAKTSRIRPLVLWALALTWMLHSTYEHLPSRLASQWNFAGDPVSWMPKDFYVLFFGILAVSLNFSFFGMRFLLGSKKLRPFFNIPWKSYWLENEVRWAEAEVKLDQMLYWGGTLMNLVLVGVHTLVLNQNGARTFASFGPNEFVTAVGVALALYLTWIVKLFRPRTIGTI